MPLHHFCLRAPRLRRALLCATVLLGLLVPAGSARAFQGSSPGQTGSIENARLRVQFTHVGLVGNRWQAIGISQLCTVDAQGQAVDTQPLTDSPLWRIDFRSLADLRNQTGHDAAWYLVPSLTPADNVQPGMGLASSNLVWVDTADSRGPSVEFEILSSTYAQLRWSSVPVDAWYPQFRGVFDVTVHLRLDAANVKPPELSIDVEVSLEDQVGALDVGVLSTSFPDLMLPELTFGAENSKGSDVDDLLLVPMSHGNLVPQPIQVLNVAPTANITAQPEPSDGFPWPEDTVKFDFGKIVQDGVSVGNHARNLTFPGETCSQFMFYYDCDMAEPFVHFNRNGRILGYGPRPSLQGGGPGIYVAAHDPDINVKRIVPEGRDGFMRVAIRTFVAFDPARSVSLFDPSNAPPGTLWQAYHQGPDSSQDDPSVPKDLHFPWPVVLDFFRGDWLDAAQQYKTFFDAESIGVYRDPNAADPQAPVRFRDLPESYAPAPYKNLLAIVGLAEEAVVNEQVVPIGGADGEDYQDAADHIYDYFDFLREDYASYQDTVKFPDMPYLSVLHPLGMKDGTEAAKSGGSDRADSNTDPREGYADFLALIRQTANGGPNYVLTAQNRDHGSWTNGDSMPVMPSDLRVLTETQQDAWRNPGASPPDLMVGYDRIEARENLQAQLNDSLGRFVPPDVAVTEIPLDWYWTSGQGSAAKPDYSFWSVPPTGGENQTGGGNLWTLGQNTMRESFVGSASTLIPDGTSLPVSPFFYLSTERLSESILLRNVPSGHRRLYPAKWQAGINAGEGAHMALFSEVVGLTSFLYHDYTLMRGEGFSFAEFYGYVGKCPTSSPSTTAADYQDHGLFLQDECSERMKGERITRYRLARVVIHLGLVPQASVELIKTQGPDGWPLLCDIGGAGLDSLDDRLDSNQFQVVGKDDVAKSYSGDDIDNPLFFRTLLRTRSRFREFLIGGIRVRDPQLLDPGTPGNPWWAEDLFFYRWKQADAKGGTPKLDTGALFSGKGGMSLGRLVIGSYVDPSDNLMSGDVRALVVVCNPFFDDPPNYPDVTVEYTLQFDATEWPLPASESYTAQRVDLTLMTQEVGPGFTPTSTSVTIQPAAGVLGGALHYWAMVVD